LPFWPPIRIGVSEQGKVQHLPLGRALEEYAGAKNRAGAGRAVVAGAARGGTEQTGPELLDSRAIFHPQVWRPEQAFSFLQNIPLFEQSGLVVRIPDWWKAGRPPRPQVTVRIGEAKGNLLGKDSLLDFKVNVAGGRTAHRIGTQSHPAIRQRPGVAQRQVGRGGPGQTPGSPGSLEKVKPTQAPAGCRCWKDCGCCRALMPASRANRKRKRRALPGRASWREGAEEAAR
jgi:hypothetical protein